MTPAFEAAPSAPPGDRAVAQPFPGLRSFRPEEAHLFFGRDDQCDQLLARLERRRLVAVVGRSGSGKSSLVLAGLIPALERGYLPSAGSSWQIAVVRPGSRPIANLARALATSRVRGVAISRSAEEVAALLDASSLGIAAFAQRMAAEGGDDSLLVVVDQFEELFTFRRSDRTAAADEEVAGFVQLLLSAVHQDAVPVYVVLTMRSDYLGDCAEFTGLPEALNDSQFLVPRLTRDQLRDVIECPMAVGGAHPAPRLVQRLLHDLESLSRGTRGIGRRADADHDQLPLLQHVLMRVWDVSAADRSAGASVDLRHYEDPIVGTIDHALDRHAEEAYASLGSDRERGLARKVFKRLAERDSNAREVRNPTALEELGAFALGKPRQTIDEDDLQTVRKVIAKFSDDRRDFLVINEQLDVDVSHESFIRQWSRYQTWLDEEARARRIYRALADAAGEWRNNERSLYRGRELDGARQWWRSDAPTAEWAERYGGGFALADTYLRRSVWRRMLVAGTVTLAGVLIVGLAIGILIVQRNAARGEAQLQAQIVDTQNKAQDVYAQLQSALANASSSAERERLTSAALANAQGYADEAKRLQQQLASGRPPSPDIGEIEKLRRELDARGLQIQTLTSDKSTLQAQLTNAQSVQADLQTKIASAQNSDRTPAAPAQVQAPVLAASADVQAIAALLKSLAMAINNHQIEAVKGLFAAGLSPSADYYEGLLRGCKGLNVYFGLPQPPITTSPTTSANVDYVYACRDNVRMDNPLSERWVFLKQGSQWRIQSRSVSK
jgi:hypothetical protein